MMQRPGDGGTIDGKPVVTVTTRSPLPIEDPISGLKLIAGFLSEIFFGKNTTVWISLWVVWRAYKKATADRLPAWIIGGRVTASKAALYAWAIQRLQSFEPPERPVPGGSGPGSRGKDQLQQLGKSVACGVCGQYGFSFMSGSQLVFQFALEQLRLFFEGSESRYAVESFEEDTSTGCERLDSGSQLAFSFLCAEVQLSLAFEPVIVGRAWEGASVACTTRKRQRWMRLSRKRQQQQQQRRLELLRKLPLPRKLWRISNRAAGTWPPMRGTGNTLSCAWRVTRSVRRLVSRAPPRRRNALR